MEIIKYNEILDKKKYLFSISFFRMLDTFRSFEKTFNSFKSLLIALNSKQKIFDIRIYYDESVQTEVESIIKEYTNFEFYKFNYQKYKINKYHNGVFGNFANFLSLTSEYSKEYEYVYITDVDYKYEWIDWEIIDFIIKNNVNTFNYYLPSGGDQYKINYPIFTKNKINLSIINNFFIEIDKGKYNEVINNLLDTGKLKVTYNYKVLFPYKIDEYFLNNIIYQEVTNGSVYVEITYDLLRLIHRLYRYEYKKIYNLDSRSQEILEELRKLNEIKYNTSDLNIKGTIITLIVKFLNKFGREDFKNLFNDSHKKVINLFYTFVDKNEEKVNNNKLYKLSEFIKIK